MLRFENSTELRTALGEWNARYFPPRGASETTDAFVRCSQCPSATYWNASCSGTVTEADQGSQGLADCQSYCSSDSSCDLWLIAGNSVYQRFDTLKTHADAKADCESRGMRLATVRSAADNARLVTVAFGGGNTASPFFGANDIAVEGEWRESSDPSSPLVSYTNWNDASHGGNEPNDSGDGEDCVQVRTDGLWNDVRCTSTLPYICEVDAYRWDSDGAALSDTYSTFADGQGRAIAGLVICVGKPWSGYPKWHDCNVASEYHQVCMPTTAGGGEAGLVVNPNECDRDYS